MNYNFCEIKEFVELKNGILWPCNARILSVINLPAILLCMYVYSIKNEYLEYTMTYHACLLKKYKKE